MTEKDAALDDLIEEISLLLSLHEYREDAAGAKWCERCIDTIPHSWSWEVCEARDLREAYEKFKAAL